MSNSEMIKAITSNILVAIARVERRFANLSRPEDFILTDEGIDRLDAITMMLIAIGEQVKNLEKYVDFDLSSEYSAVDWKGVKGMRDFLSHHYFSADAEIIFDVCQNKVSSLKDAILSIDENNVQ